MRMQWFKWSLIGIVAIWIVALGRLHHNENQQCYIWLAVKSVYRDFCRSANFKVIREFIENFPSGIPTIQKIDFMKFE